MLSTMLAPMAALSTFMGTTVLHPTFFPFPLILCFHAARISLAYQAGVKRTQNWDRHTWSTYLSGYLVMAWGGSVSSHLLMGLPPPPLYNIRPWINYLGVHLGLTALLHFFPDSINPALLDSSVIPLDAVSRMGSIRGSLGLLSTSASPTLAASPMTRLIIGAVASAGGGTSAATLGVFSPNWSLGTPVFLKADVLGSLDVWSGAIAGFIFDFLTGNPAYAPLIHAVRRDQTPLDPSLPEKTVSLAYTDVPTATAAAATFLSLCYMWRVSRVHFASAPPGATEAVPSSSTNTSEKGQKAEKQG